jgi:molybdopterin-guanine dinucleotide biosynthesis protein A
VDLGFKNWYLRVLLRALQLYGHQEMSIALENPEFFAQSHQHQTTVYFTASKTIQFRQDSLNEFAQNLRATYHALTQTRQEQVVTLPADAPRVFLSYASEDVEFVEQLATNLQEAGIAVWQDKQSLRAGDNWYRVLMQVLHKQVEYVVVVQTPAMVRRLEGYFYMEITEALKRQERMKEGVRFVFPVSAGNDETLPMHCVRVDSAAGRTILISSIHEDWRQRGERRE